VFGLSKEQKIGLVAGRGALPFEVLAEIKSRGQSSVVIGLKGECSPELVHSADFYREVALGQLGAIIAAFKDQNITELVFAGKVSKEALFIEGFDNTLQCLLATLPQKNDDAILLALVQEFEKNGMTVAKQTNYLHRLLASPGMITGTITESEMADIKLGFKMAKAIGDLDIGQSVVVKKGVVLAVEAIEGTDQAIIRGGTLGGAGSVVVKVSKPRQDERFDVPAIGETTIESMINIKATVLAIEAGKTLIVQKEGVLALAAENQIKIISCSF
jgi:UDP-2,3-diacylglucosamine hydrolase